MDQLRACMLVTTEGWSLYHHYHASTAAFATVRVYTHGNSVTSSLDNLRTIVLTNCGVVDGQREIREGVSLQHISQPGI